MPDDVKARIAAPTWEPRDDICTGCRGLRTPWAPLNDEWVGVGVAGVGPGVRVYSFGINSYDVHGPAEGRAYFNESDEPIAGWRFSGGDCGLGMGAFHNRADGVAMVYGTTLGEDQDFIARSLGALPELMTATDTTLVWPGTFIGKTIPTGLWFSDQYVAAFFTGRLGVGHIPTGKVAWVNEAKGALPGQYLEAQVAGSTVLVSRYDYTKQDWFTYADGALKPFIGAADRDIRALATDGKLIIWVEGSQPLLNDAGGTVFQQWDVYKAPFASDASKLQPELVVANLPGAISNLSMENGYVSGIYYTVPGTDSPLGAFVVRIADGWAAKSELEAPYHWGYYTFPGPTELWGGARIGLKGKTIIKVPYAGMEVIQTNAPAGRGT